jgi:dUTPase
MDKLDIKYKQSTVGLKTPKVEHGNLINVYAAEEVIISPSETKAVKTATTYEVPEGYVMLVVPSLVIAEHSSLRFANSISFVPSGKKEELNLLLENVVPLGMRKNIAPEFHYIDGEFVQNNYSKGYLPVGSVVVRKGDCIGQAFIVKAESFTISRMAKRETKDEKQEQ